MGNTVTLTEAFMQCFGAFVGCLGFAFVFRIHRNIKFAVVASLGGTLGWIVYLITVTYVGSVFASLYAMMSVAFFSEIMARILKAPSTLFIVVGCFPLVPGKGIYTTMLYLITIKHNLYYFQESLLETIGIALALATAILIVSSIFKVIKVIKTKDFKL